MFFNKKVVLSFFIFINLTASAVFASGDESSDDDSQFEEPNYGSTEVPQRVVDPIYESGKSVYTGRSKSAPKLSYCLGSGESAVKVKRKSIKSFKKASFSELAKNLYSCDVPDQTIKSQLERKDFLHVLYYLNKRYKLNLARS